MEIFRTLGSKSLSNTVMLIFSGKANTSIHGLGVDDTARPRGGHTTLLKELWGSTFNDRHFKITRQIVSLDIKGCICHFTKCQIHPSFHIQGDVIWWFVNGRPGGFATRMPPAPLPTLVNPYQTVWIRVNSNVNHEVPAGPPTPSPPPGTEPSGSQPEGLDQCCLTLYPLHNSLDLI